MLHTREDEHTTQSEGHKSHVWEEVLATVLLGHEVTQVELLRRKASSGPEGVHSLH